MAVPAKQQHHLLAVLLLVQAQLAVSLQQQQWQLQQQQQGAQVLAALLTWQLLLPVANPQCQQQVLLREALLLPLPSQQGLLLLWQASQEHRQ
jgi:hypothetical protein